MSSTEPYLISCAHSPDADDAFMFYALATRRLRSPKVRFQHILEDIQSLNEKALRGEYELTALSYHAYPFVADKYVLLRSGSSVGDGYGPLIVSGARLQPEELKNARVAVPGKLTTAFLVLKIFEPSVEVVEVPFDQIIEKVRSREVEAGVVIHEGQLTYAKAGVYKVLDLGAWWKERFGLPLPLGANAIRRDLPPEVIQECARLIRQSIEYALKNREEALRYAMQFARDLENELADQFVGMYVNHYTVELDEKAMEAAQRLIDMGFELGLIPQRTRLEFV